MSADNGVYILKTRKSESGKDFEFRVNVIYAINNVFKKFGYLYNAFEHAEIFPNYHAAEKAAIDIDNDLNSEFDVLLIERYSDRTWKQIEASAKTETETAQTQMEKV